MCERYTLTDAGRFNIAPGQLAPVQLRDGTSDLRWGLLAPWRGHGGKRGPMVYEAPHAAIAATPLLRNAHARRRCLVLADGWYIWRKQRAYWVHAPARVAFAGLAATHVDDGIASFAIVVVPSAGLVTGLAPTMPAVVDERWLAAPILECLPLERLRADPVSSHVDKVDHDDPRCVMPLGNPAQGELF